MPNLDAKNSIGLSLLIIGLFVVIWGLGVGDKVIMQTINGTEVPLNNFDYYQWNWRVFMGLGAAFTGILLLLFPSIAVIEKETGRA